METDSFCYQLFKRLPQTLFHMLGLPGEQARAYRFDSVEVKKSYRIDGLLFPTKGRLPIYFIEALFYRKANFYANLFAKLFGYLDENDPGQEWVAVAAFGSRNLEPTQVGPYDDLLRSKRVKRFYLDELPLPADPPLGLSILQLVTASPEQEKPLVARLLHKAGAEISDSEVASTVVELVEELLIRRHPKMTRDEVRAMFQLEDLRKTRVWQEALEEGETAEQGRIVRRCLASGMSAKETAALLAISVAKVRRLAKEKSENGQSQS